MPNPALRQYTARRVGAGFFCIFFGILERDMRFDEDDLGKLLEENLRLAKENNKILKAMRRDEIMGRIFKLIFFALVIGVPIVLYYYFLQPYITEIRCMYESMQGSVNELQEIRDNVPELPDWAQDLLGGESAAQKNATTT